MRTITRGVDTFTVQDTPGRDWGFWDQFGAGLWEPATFDTLDRLLTPAATYFDVGAWVGPTVIYAARRCGLVVAVEPDPVALEGLRTNIALNASGVVAVIAGALAPHSGGATLHSNSGWGSSMSSLLPTGGDTCEVSAYTFDDLVDRFGLPSLVKMDIEGAEALVLDEVSSRCCELGAALLVSLHGPYWPPGWAPDLSRFGKLTVLEAVGGFSVLLGEP